MCLAIDVPSNCEIRAVILFLHARSTSHAEIHHDLSLAVCGRNVVRERNERQRWDGEQMFTVKSEVVGLPSAVSDDHLRSERRRFTISEIECEFSQFSRTLF
jgi:hypothetical protein